MEHSDDNLTNNVNNNNNNNIVTHFNNSNDNTSNPIMDPSHNNAGSLTFQEDKTYDNLPVLKGFHRSPTTTNKQMTGNDRKASLRKVNTLATIPVESKTKVKKGKQLVDEDSESEDEEVMEVSPEVKKLLQEAQNSSTLNLSNRNLTQIPEEVYALTSLTALDLSNNRITRISPHISQLTALISLNLSANALKKLPNELGLLTNLKDLRIAFNPLSAEVKIDHYRGTLLEKMWLALDNVNNNNSDSKHKGKTSKNKPSPEPMSKTNGRRYSIGSFSSLPIGKKEKPTLASKGKVSSVSSFSFEVKAPKWKHSKETKEKMKQWKKHLGFLLVNDIMRSRIIRPRMYGPPHALTMLDFDDNEEIMKDIRKEARMLEKKNSKAQLLQKWAKETRTYRGTYNFNFPCAVRPLYLKKEEKAQFYQQMCAIGESKHPFINHLEGILKYKKGRVKFQYEPLELNIGPSPVLAVTETMAQGSLAEWLHSNYSEGVSLKKRLHIAKQVAMGMQCLHATVPTIIHHNLKSSNVLFSDNWNAKVSDYFLGNRFMKEFKETTFQEKIPEEPIISNMCAENVDDDSKLPSPSLPYWMSPEILQGIPYTEKVDVYSFGMLAWETITSEVPWKELKTTRELINNVCTQQKRPIIPDTVPTSVAAMIDSCWHADPLRRPSFVQIVNKFDDLIVDSALDDPVGRQLWKMYFKAEDSVSWKEFTNGFFEFLKVKHRDPVLMKYLHDVVADSDEVVTIENFGKMLQWFGPFDGMEMVERIYKLVNQKWFHGNLSSIQSEDLLQEKAKGTFLIRFSASNPGSFAISTLNEDGQVKHYKVWHQAGAGYSVGKETYNTLEELIQDRQDLLCLKFPCPKGERYSDSNFWVTHVVDEDETKTVVSLKQLCFRFIYKNSHLFQGLQERIPLDLIEEYYSTIVDSITSEDSGRLMWKTCFLGKDIVTFDEFTEAFYKFLGLTRNKNSTGYQALHAIIKDIVDDGSDQVSLETFSKFLEWFGPMNAAIIDHVTNIVCKVWFHGNLTHLQAEKLIQKKSNAVKGTFLIRFSSKNRGYFTITVVGRKQSLLHYRVYYNRSNLEYMMGKKTFHSLDEIIVNYHRELCLREPCRGSKFKALQPEWNNGRTEIHNL